MSLILLLLLISASWARRDVISSSQASVKLLKTGVLSFAPWLELHHVVLINILNPENKIKAGGIYAIDFSPINQTDPKTLLKLLCGRSVPGEIRIRWIPTEGVLNDKNIKKTWSCLGSAGNPLLGSDKGIKTMNERVNKRLSVTNKIAPPANIKYNIEKSTNYNQIMDDLIQKINGDWAQEMNLYTHNCQHFSHFVSKYLSSIL